MDERSSRIHPDNRAVELRALASTLFSCLPRELRNRIYTFCLEYTHDEDVIVRHSSHNKSGLIFLTRQCLEEHSYRWVEDPVISLIGSHRLGHDVAREMLESYYWNRNFKLANKEILQLETFLKTDSFELGLVPAHYIRRLQIQIQPYVLMATQFSMAEDRLEESYLVAIENSSKTLTTRTVVLIEVDLAEGSHGHAEPFGNTAKVEKLVAKYELLADTLKKEALRVELTYRMTWRGE